MARLADPEIRLLGNLQLPERYEVKRRIAHGGMASVWCAHDRILGRDVAIKMLAEQFAHDPTSIRRFKREARAAARLSGHPHVVTIYDVSEATDLADDGRRAFIVMEHLAGGTVADALRVGAVTREDTLRWLHEAASALDYAHGSGVVHRDIKPANFLLDRGRGLHVADFGIARLGSEETITSTGYLLGTAAYLSPERVLGQRATDAGDRYALAVVAFELLTGERPFTAEHFAAQARLHVEQPVPRASGRDAGIPRAVDAVLARGMAKQPEDRWPTATALVDTLDLALTERAGRSIRRGGAMSAAATAIAAPATAAAQTPAPAARPERRPPPSPAPTKRPAPREPRSPRPGRRRAAALATGAEFPGAGSRSPPWPRPPLASEWRRAPTMDRAALTLAWPRRAPSRSFRRRPAGRPAIGPRITPPHRIRPSRRSPGPRPPRRRPLPPPTRSRRTATS